VVAYLSYAEAATDTVGQCGERREGGPRTATRGEKKCKKIVFYTSEPVKLLKTNDRAFENVQKRS
jgi:hypothetical protein